MSLDLSNIRLAAAFLSKTEIKASMLGSGPVGTGSMTSSHCVAQAALGIGSMIISLVGQAAACCKVECKALTDWL
jgi:hypothetical protein